MAEDDIAGSVHDLDATETLVETSGLTRRFGDFTALDHCTLKIARGEVFGLLGPNGAGKSTLIRLLLGFMRPTAGWGKIDGLDVHADQIAVHRRLSYLPGDARLFRTMNGRQVLKFFAQVRGEPLDRALEIAERLELNLRRWVAFMSTGMRQKLALTVAVSVRKPLMILDEPTANLDPTVRQVVLQMVREARSEGRTVIFSSHVLSEIEDVCDRVGILRAGKLVHLQSVATIQQRHRLMLRGIESGSELPESLATGAMWDRDARTECELVVTSQLTEVLRWLLDRRAQIVRVQPEGLRSIYHRYHRLPSEEDS